MDASRERGKVVGDVRSSCMVLEAVTSSPPLPAVQQLAIKAASRQ